MQTMTPKVPKDKLRKTTRRRKVIELKAEGKTIAEIAATLDVSEKTVDRDLQSQDVHAFLEELARRQIIDIENSKPLIRLQYRSDLLDKLLPKKQEIKQDVKYASNNGTTELLKLIASIDKRIAQEDSLSKDNTAEPIHPSETNGQTRTVPANQ
jgi:IS30 family transposase